MKFTYLIILSLIFVQTFGKTKKLKQVDNELTTLRKNYIEYQAPAPAPAASASKIKVYPYTSKNLIEFASGVGLSITGEVGDKDVISCFTPKIKSSSKDMENDTKKLLSGLLVNLLKLNKLLKPAMSHRDLFCFKDNKQRLIIRLEELFGTFNTLNFYRRPQSTKKKRRSHSELKRKLNQNHLTYPVTDVSTSPYWHSHFNTFFAYNLNNLRDIRNKIYEFLGSDLSFETKNFLGCLLKKKNKDSKSHKSIAKSQQKIETLLSGMSGFLDVIVNGICQWSNYSSFVENLIKAKKEKTDDKKFNLYGRAIGELIMAIGAK